jgi:catalase
MQDDKVRGKPEKFAEHYNQATLFFHSQTEVEKQHIIRAFRFELTKVQTTAVRERVVAQLRNVDETLAAAVADGIGLADLPEALPDVLKKRPKAEVAQSPTLSLTARPGSIGILSRKIAILVADGVDGDAAMALHQALSDDGAVPRFIGVKLGRVTAASGDVLEVEASMETMPSVLWDGVIVPAGAAAALNETGHTPEFIKDQYRHCKTIMVLGDGVDVLMKAGIPTALPNGETDPGILAGDENGEAAAVRFAEALAKHRHFDRETDPPRV